LALAAEGIRTHQTHKGLVNERGGLERLARLLLGQLPGRESAQLIVDQGEQLGRGPTVGWFAGPRAVGHFGHRWLSSVGASRRSAVEEFRRRRSPNPGIFPRRLPRTC